MIFEVKFHRLIDTSYSWGTFRDGKSIHGMSTVILIAVSSVCKHNTQSKTWADIASLGSNELKSQ